MKAYIRKRYCAPENLELQNFQKPTPKADEILVKVRAVSINPADWHLIRGTPFLVRFLMGFPKPKNIFVGADVSGVVEEIGTKVTEFKISDEVFTDVMGTGAGSYAEYICVKATQWVSKPKNISHEAAAAVPIAGLTALQGLRDHGELKKGQKVLINGASGGVGTYAVQLAKWMGADVTAVCSSSKIALVKSLGADQIIDYTQENLGSINSQFDLVFDAVGNITAKMAQKLLTTHGICLLIGWGGFSHMMAFSISKAWINRFTKKRLGSFTAKMKVEDLKQMADLLAFGEIKSVIDKNYPFNELKKAIAYQEQGHSAGKVIVTVAG